MARLTIPSHDGKSFGAYIARPAKTPAPAVIVIQEIFGINQELREKCDDLAAQGYMAVCPDLFWRIEPGIELVDSIPEQLQRAFDLFGQFDIAKGMADLAATLAFLRKDRNVTGGIGCVGYCLGGKLAYMMAAQTDIDASVSYYGVGIEGLLDQTKNIRKPLMLHIAGEDQYVPKEAQQKIIDTLSPNPQVTIHAYPGCEHAFARGRGMHFNAEAAELANAHTAAFFAQNLKQKMAA